MIKNVTYTNVVSSNAEKYGPFQGVWKENVGLKLVMNIRSKATGYSFATCLTNATSLKSRLLYRRKKQSRQSRLKPGLREL